MKKPVAKSKTPKVRRHSLKSRVESLESTSVTYSRLAIIIRNYPSRQEFDALAKQLEDQRLPVPVLTAYPEPVVLFPRDGNITETPLNTTAPLPKDDVAGVQPATPEPAPAAPPAVKEELVTCDRISFPHKRSERGTPPCLNPKPVAPSIEEPCGFVLNVVNLAVEHRPKCELPKGHLGLHRWNLGSFTAYGTEAARMGQLPSAPADLASDPNTIAMHDLRKP